MTNTQLITRFYESFAYGDAEEMVSCYSPNVIFRDPVFGELKGEEAKNMWRMLIQRSRGALKINFYDVQANDKTASASWIAEYVFSQTDRRVINKIQAKFELENGLITKHTDHFDLWRWSRQALGWKGLLLGWTPPVQNKIREQSGQLLKQFSARIGK